MAANRAKDIVYNQRAEWLGWFSLILLSCVFVMYALPYIGLGFSAVLAFFPFIAGGHYSRREQIHIIYYWDLAGAGLGADLAMGLMNLFNPVHAMSMISFVFFLISIIITFRYSSPGERILVGSIGSILLFNTILPFSHMIPFRAYISSPANVFVKEQNEKNGFFALEFFFAHRCL